MGGSGTIAPEEIRALEAHGVEKIYTPEDGRPLGLKGMIEDVIHRIGSSRQPPCDVVGANYTETLSHNRIPKLALPRFEQLLRPPFHDLRRFHDELTN